MKSLSGGGGEYSTSPVVQPTPKVTPVKSPENGVQVKEQAQQALLHFMEAQATAQAEQTGIQKCYKCGDPGHFKVSGQNW